MYRNTLTVNTNVNESKSNVNRKVNHKKKYSHNIEVTLIKFDFLQLVTISLFQHNYFT